MGGESDEKLKAILIRNFAENESILVGGSTESLPLVAANVKKSTRSFSLGQIVYIYDVYWGMNEHARVLGRFRRKHNWICGVIPIKNLERFRAKIVYNPSVIKKLEGESIHRNIFPRFLQISEWVQTYDHVFEDSANSLRIQRFVQWLKELFRG